MAMSFGYCVVACILDIYPNCGKTASGEAKEFPIKVVKYKEPKSKTVEFENMPEVDYIQVLMGTDERFILSSVHFGAPWVEFGCKHVATGETGFIDLLFIEKGLELEIEVERGDDIEPDRYCLEPAGPTGFRNFTDFPQIRCSHDGFERVITFLMQDEDYTLDSPSFLTFIMETR